MRNKFKGAFAPYFIVAGKSLHVAGKYNRLQVGKDIALA